MVSTARAEAISLEVQLGLPWHWQEPTDLGHLFQAYQRETGSVEQQLGLELECWYGTLALQMVA